jgi:hypothetical protein
LLAVVLVVPTQLVAGLEAAVQVDIAALYLANPQEEEPAQKSH